MNNQNNQNNIFLEEGEIIEENQDEEESEEEGEEAEWGGVENEVIMPIGLIPIIQEQTSLHLSSRQSRIRPRDETDSQSHSNKIFRNASGKRVVRERTPLYSYLRLKSGEEFYFTEEDGKKIILNESIEPNRLIRNIISKIPNRLGERLDYLGKFEYEEDSDEEDSEEENSQKVKKRYLGNLKELVYEAYIKEWRLRFLFKIVIVLWRMYKMNKTCEKELDPITLTEPEKEIYVYDWDNRKKFVFDAKSLATLIETKLMYHEYGFPVPMYPRNPKNNVEFSYKQMISLYYQLKNHGELRWGFTTLREFNFNKHLWHMYHKSALTMNAIKANISLLDTIEGRELLLDFIFAKMDELGINHTQNIFNIYQKAMIRVPNHWYLEKLKMLAVSHYEGEHFGQNRTRLINYSCQKIFRKHNMFVVDLKNKKIIN